LETELSSIVAAAEGEGGRYFSGVVGCSREANALEEYFEEDLRVIDKRGGVEWCGLDRLVYMVGTSDGVGR
jgi:hypothetical protein